MRTRLVAASFAAAIAVLLSACGRANTASMDEGLKQDLAAVGGSTMELAPRSGSQMVVSAIEGGPKSSPSRASAKRAIAPKAVIKRAQQPTQSVAQAPVRAPAPVIMAPAPVVAEPVEPAPLPAIQAPVARQPTKRQTGPYKTEAEIFREMPWIRP